MIDLDLRRRHDDWGNCEELLDPIDAERIDEGEWMRAAGACVCGVCGRPFYDHESVLGALWLTRLCDNELVKL